MCAPQAPAIFFAIFAEFCRDCCVLVCAPQAPTIFLRFLQSFVAIFVCAPQATTIFFAILAEFCRYFCVRAAGADEFFAIFAEFCRYFCVRAAGADDFFCDFCTSLRLPWTSLRLLMSDCWRHTADVRNVSRRMSDNWCQCDVEHEGFNTSFDHFVWFQRYDFSSKVWFFVKNMIFRQTSDFSSNVDFLVKRRFFTRFAREKSCIFFFYSWETI